MNNNVCIRRKYIYFSSSEISVHEISGNLGLKNAKFPEI